jgi:hypothetical protein
MAEGVWNQAVSLLREAADIIEQRAKGRDVPGRADTITLAALAEGLTEAQVLAAHIGTKRIRFNRGGDRDSAVDLLAYEARRLVALLPASTAPEFTGTTTITSLGTSVVLAEAQFEAACSGPALNHAGGDIAE